MEYFLLALLAFAAGCIDAISGGGGLVQLPALLITFPSAPVPFLLGTNKLASCSGTFVAAFEYRHQVAIKRTTMAVMSMAAGAGSAVGALLTTILPQEAVKPCVIAVLLGITVVTLRDKSLRRGLQIVSSKNTVRLSLLKPLLIGGIIGIYDGFLGPGTGSILIFCFVYFLQSSFLEATAAAKVVNGITNAAALIYFLYTGYVFYTLGIVMALCNSMGAVCGSRLARKKGADFVRVIFLAVTLLILFRLCLDYL